MIGYGLSSKPDRDYSVGLQADVVQAFVAEAGVSSLALLTHDLGDTVGGELLARQAEGGWPVEITRRVITNGSIYIEMAHLSTGQQLLLSLPDERLPDTAGIDSATLQASLAATFSSRSRVEESDLAGASELVTYDGGHLLLPRTIRYIEERRKNQTRFTGAIESHSSPLAIVWGTDDPIAVAAMATRLHGVRPDATLRWLEDVGHYPMIESPECSSTPWWLAWSDGRRRRPVTVVLPDFWRSGTAPHRPDRRAPGDDDLSGDLESVSTVEGDVALLGGLEICPDALSVTVLEDGCEQRRADALSLIDGIGSEHGQVPVGHSGVVALDGGEHAQCSGHLQPEGGDHLGRGAQDLSDMQLPTVGGIP